jgi:hypothetical protein
MGSLLSTTAIMLPCAALLPSTAEMSACLARHARIRRDKLEGETVATATIKAPRCAGDASRQPHRAQRLIRLPSQIHAPAPLVLVQHCVVRCLAQLCTQPWGWQALAPHSLHHSIGTLAPENSRAHRQRRCEAQAAADCAPRTAHRASTYQSCAGGVVQRRPDTRRSAAGRQAGKQTRRQAGRGSQTAHPTLPVIRRCRHRRVRGGVCRRLCQLAISQLALRPLGRHARGLWPPPPWPGQLAVARRPRRQRCWLCLPLPPVRTVGGGGAREAAHSVALLPGGLVAQHLQVPPEIHPCHTTPHPTTPRPTQHSARAKTPTTPRQLWRAGFCGSRCCVTAVARATQRGDTQHLHSSTQHAGGRVGGGAAFTHPSG